MLIDRSLNDFELLTLLKEGNQSAYAEIFRRYSHVLFGHAYKKLGDKEAAKDIIQEIFINLWAKHADIVITSNLSGYLFTAVRNKIYNEFSHKRVESEYIKSLQDFLDQECTETDHPIREKQFQELIEHEIQSLPPKMRLVFEMSRKEYMSHGDIAIALNISKQTVTDQIKKALRIIRLRITIIIWFACLISCKYFF